MASFPTERGKIICFYNTDNEILKMEAKSVHHILKYYHTYDTSEFAIKITTISASANLCGHSKKNVKHKIFVEVPNSVQDYTCQTTKLAVVSAYIHTGG